jgi:hypothetical protein
LEAIGLPDLFGDRFTEDEKAKKTRAKKNASKTKFECPQCGLNAWAKPDARLLCGDCAELMVCADPEDEQEDA